MSFFLRQNALTFSFPIKSNPLLFSSKCISLFLSPTKWYCLLVTDQLCLLTSFQPIMLVYFYLAINSVGLFFLDRFCLLPSNQMWRKEGEKQLTLLLQPKCANYGAAMQWSSILHIKSSLRAQWSRMKGHSVKNHLSICPEILNIICQFTILILV